MPANFARLLWANYTSSWSKSLAIDKIDSHTVVSLTILGRTDRGRERETGAGSKERWRKEKEKGRRNRKGRGGGPLFRVNVCMHICIRIQAERSMYNRDKVMLRGEITRCYWWKYASGKLTKARETVRGERVGRRRERKPGEKKNRNRVEQQQSPGAGNKRRHAE